MTDDGGALSGDNADESEDEIFTIDVLESDQGERLDRWLAAQDTGLSRTRLKQLITEGAVLADGKPCDDPSFKIRAGLRLTVMVPPPLDDTPVPENIPLAIVYEDSDLLVINKPAGLVVHPAPGHSRGTLVNALLFHCGESLSGIGGVRRPGIVHRLDKDTSGLMIVAKNDKAHQGLSAQLADRTLSRHYRAFVWGKPNLRRSTVDIPIGRHHVNRQKMAVNQKNGRTAITHYEILEMFGDGVAALAECRLETGRTHQIRVHMAHIQHPLVGDPVYGIQPTAAAALLKKGRYEPEAAAAIRAFPRQALHAGRIAFIHPGTGAEMAFERPLPPDMERLLSLFKSIG